MTKSKIYITFCILSKYNNTIIVRYPIFINRFFFDYIQNSGVGNSHNEVHFFLQISLLLPYFYEQFLRELGNWNKLLHVRQLSIRIRSLSVYIIPIVYLDYYKDIMNLVLEAFVWKQFWEPKKYYHLSWNIPIRTMEIFLVLNQCV